MQCESSGRLVLDPRLMDYIDLEKNKKHPPCHIRLYIKALKKGL